MDCHQQKFATPYYVECSKQGHVTVRLACRRPLENPTDYTTFNCNKNQIHNL